MERVEHIVTIDRPLAVVYDQWTQFELFPRYVRGLKAAHQVDATHVLCRFASVDGAQSELEIEITEQVPNVRISWRSVEGVRTAGTVRFESRDQGLYPHTQVRLVLAWDGPRASFGLVDMRAFEALERFKVFIETRKTATGGWRGEIDQGVVQGQPL